MNLQTVDTTPMHPAVNTSPSENFADIRKKQFRPAEFIIEQGIRFTAFFSLAFILLIFVFVFREASSIFSPEKNVAPLVKEEVQTYTGDNEVQSYGDENITVLSSPDNEAALKPSDTQKLSIRNIFDKVWQPTSVFAKFGIWPLFAGSLKVAFLSLLISAPVAIFAAIYTSSFASKHIKEIVKPVVEILAGFPSVVIGFIALIVFASVLQSIFGLQYRLNAFTGSVAMAIAIIPVIFTLSEDALNSVPRSYIDASLALGSERWETAILVVLPAAVPGIFAAILLGIGRAIGETMIVLMATGNAAFASFNPFEPVRTMSATIGAEMAEVVFGDFHYSVLFFIGIILFAISFLINLTAETVVRNLVMRQFK